ncbi:DUF2680 domain-containing protein [Sporomusa acidovorans]|uniref:DUF2680 domain-containing protein n=1 Tax=Sporomusa acidovorans TaxID=112900 RepID=UPI00088D3A09|nr:DUF2680 domain-containing protein [Sporomusa acidovorans]OZC19064.1 hypothetical protein SPACI_31500 [Sporomusa acidovorans DSM 3132]SDD66162.1 Protein of unknown function [Sporomusa acidovorans]
MKKGLIIGLAASLVITLGATLAFAESTAPGMMDKGQMNEMHKKMVEQHVKDGVLTPEQAKAMDEHMANMGSMMNGMMSGNGGMMGGNASCHSSQQSTDIPQQ